jgi:hypothetical protein
MAGYGICDRDSILDKARDSAATTEAQSASKATEACFIAKGQNTKCSWELSNPITTFLHINSSRGTYRESDG